MSPIVTDNMWYLSLIKYFIDWLPKQEDGPISPTLDYPLKSLVPFCVHKNATKELGQYPAILTSRLVSNEHIFYGLKSLIIQSNKHQAFFKL